MPNKQQILRAIVDLGRKLGRTPSRRQFLSQGGITEYKVMQCFGTWTDAVKATGFQPYTLNMKVEDRTLLEDWGKVVRKNRGAPSPNTYLRDGKYSPSTVEKRFGRWSSVPEAFRHFAKGKRKWKDVLALLPGPACARVRRGPRPKAGRQCPNNSPAPALPPDKAWPAQLPAPRRSQVHSQVHLHIKDRPIYGTPTQFPWLRYEPVNEQGVVLLFGMLAKELGYMIEKVQTEFPDCEAMRQVGPERWQRVRIEFEFESRNFRDHGHAANGCDVIVCWRHNWQECPERIEVVELSRVIKSLANSEA